MATAPPSSNPKEVTGGKWGAEEPGAGTGHRLGCRGWGAEVGVGKILLTSSSVQKEFLWSGVALTQRLGLHP